MQGRDLVPRRFGDCDSPWLRSFALDGLKVLLPPVDEYLRAEGPEAEEELLDFAAALDDRVMAGDTFDEIATALKCESAAAREAVLGVFLEEAAHALLH